MSEEKSICIIEFSGKQSDWDGWHEKLLLCKKNKIGYDVVPKESEYDSADGKSSKDADDKKIIALANPEKHGFGRVYIKRYYHRRRDKDDKASLTREEEDRIFVMNLEGSS